MILLPLPLIASFIIDKVLKRININRKYKRIIILAPFLISFTYLFSEFHPGNSYFINQLELVTKHKIKNKTDIINRKTENTEKLGGSIYALMKLEKTDFELILREIKSNKDYISCYATPNEHILQDIEIKSFSDAYSYESVDYKVYRLYFDNASNTILLTRITIW